jgi:hypothetical protein
VVIVSDLFDETGWRAALEELTAKRYQILVIHIVDAEETQPKPWGDVALMDVEAGRERKFLSRCRSGTALSNRDRAIFQRDRNGVRAPAHRLLAHDHSSPFDEFVLKTLRQVGSVA